ncbi:MAG: aerobic carbon-monoxide dehydrogenase large subunit [Methylobacteriaceae bacterium]|nr:aerobic carbon-monoxide dehydrogenase large subunit [Methylobacteriaceae bacterium]
MMPASPKSGDESLASAFGIGQPQTRVEDARFVQGLGRFVDDIEMSGAAHMVVVRSPHAAAKIESIDISRATAMPGVLGVFTGKDLVTEGIGTLHTSVKRKRRDGSAMPEPPFRLLALDATRFAGDAVAIVLGDSLATAQDAAEQVSVTYEDLPSATDAVAAVREGAPAVWPQAAPDNVCFVFEQGDRAAVDAAFASAHHVTRLDFRVSRVSANSLEPRNALGVFDPAEGRYTLYTGTQMPHKLRAELAETILFVPATSIRVVSPDVGGAFGMKGSPYPEQALVLWAAKKIGRPVRWSASRNESFLSDYHARDTASSVELALNSEGIFLALRIKTHANLGAYLAFNTPHSSTNNLGGLAGTYRTPHIHAEVVGVFTTTQPNAPYRGAGRPEATYAIERVIDVAAAELGIDRVELRKRNLIPRDALPFKTGLVFTYDSGDFKRNMELALQAADWDGFETRRAEAARRGHLRGIGIANAIEIAGGPFNNPNEEAADVRFDANGDLTILLGTHNHGQGHETAFRQIAVSLLGVHPERTRVASGDTDLIAHGRGTFGSRSVMVGGAAVARASEKIVARARRIAAGILEAGENDIEFDAGYFRVAGTDRAIRIEEVARRSHVPASFPEEAEYGLSASVIVTPKEASFPNGCHICEVEIDPETGLMRLVAYVVVDDVGTIINPLLVKGQIHGGMVQGLGQIQGEEIVYDESNGQILTASFMDYGMPRAEDVPAITVISNPSPTPSNSLGVKGVGEAGTVGALPVIMNAVVDALSPLGIRHLDMPATPYRIWAAIQAAGGAAAE